MSWGAFGPGGFAAVVADMARVASTPERCTRGVSQLLFAHCVGSFAAQLYLPDHIASSAAWSSRAPRTRACALLTAHQAQPARRQHAHPAPATPFDRLSGDEREADAYIADALCGFTITPASGLPMFEACDRLPAADAFAAMPNEGGPPRSLIPQAHVGLNPDLKET